MSFGFGQRTTAREEPMDKTKSYEISKQVVLEAKTICALANGDFPRRWMMGAG